MTHIFNRPIAAGVVLHEFNPFSVLVILATAAGVLTQAELLWKDADPAGHRQALVAFRSWYFPEFQPPLPPLSGDVNSVSLERDDTGYFPPTSAPVTTPQNERPQFLGSLPANGANPPMGRVKTPGVLPPAPQLVSSIQNQSGSGGGVEDPPVQFILTKWRYERLIDLGGGIKENGCLVNPVPFTRAFSSIPNVEGRVGVSVGADQSYVQMTFENGAVTCVR